MIIFIAGVFSGHILIKEITSVVLYINCLSRGIIDSSNSLQIKSLLKMQRMLNIRI